jgi:O-methyltransferase involved in polyketide biosynthesis
MDSKQQKITLSAEEETLLITLYAKAECSRNPNPLLADPMSEEILQSIDYDFQSLHVPRKTAIMVCLRAAQFDRYAAAFMKAHPGAEIIHLGCGLDSRCLRVSPSCRRWYDLDVPEVIALRRRFFQESERCRMIPSSVTDPAWLERLEASGAPVLILAEGLLMYLREEEVRRLILALRDRFPGAEMVFDIYSRLTAASVGRHPSIRRTGATVHWGIDDAAAIEEWGPGIRLLGEWRFSGAEELGRLGILYRLAFSLAARIPAADRAHRILHYRLGASGSEAPQSAART